MLVQSSERVLGPVLATVDIQKRVQAALQPSCPPAAPQVCAARPGRGQPAQGSWEQAEWEWLMSLIYCC